MQPVDRAVAEGGGKTDAKYFVNLGRDPNYMARRCRRPYRLCRRHDRTWLGRAVDGASRWCSRTGNSGPAEATIVPADNRQTNCPVAHRPGRQPHHRGGQPAGSNRRPLVSALGLGTDSGHWPALRLLEPSKEADYSPFPVCGFSRHNDERSPSPQLSDLSLVLSKGPGGLKWDGIGPRPRVAAARRARWRDLANRPLPVQAARRA